MKIIDRYIIQSVAVSMTVVLLVLVALFSFFGFMEELNNVGKGDYDVGLAIMYMLLEMPNLIYQLIPITALIGSIMGLGMLSNYSELIAIRSAGVSLLRIIGAVMKVGAVVMVLAIIMGEWVAPQSERLAQTLKTVSLSSKIKARGAQGLWAKDGNNIINIRSFLPGERLAQVYIFELGEQHQIRRILYAQSVSYRNDQWVLENVASSELNETGVVATQIKEMVWQTGLSPELISVVTLDPTTLPVIGLYQYLTYRQENGLNTQVYEQALWAKLSLPLVTVVMVLLSIPFVFGSLRMASTSYRVFLGVLVGVLFHLANQLFGHIGAVYQINTALSALLPTGLALVVALVMIRRVH